MVGPVRPKAPLSTNGPAKKKKSSDPRFRAVAKKIPKVLGASRTKSKASSKVSTPEATLAAQRTAAIAKQKSLIIQAEGVKAQKSAFASARAHMLQQSAALRRALAAERAKKQAEENARKSAREQRVKKIKTYQMRSGKKNLENLLEKYLPKKKKKKK